LNENYHLYTNIHPLAEPPQQGRGKEDDILGVCLFATDVDAKDFIEDPNESMKAIAERGDYQWTAELLSECKEKALTHINQVCSEVDVLPSAIIDSGHGYYPIFFLDRFYEFRDDKHRNELKEVNRILHEVLSSDATFDFARLLRISGSMNIKPGYPAPCKIIEFYPERRYTIDDIRKFEALVVDASDISMAIDELPKTEPGSQTPEPKEAPKESETEISDAELEPILNLISSETRRMIETGEWAEGKKTKDGKPWSRSERDQTVIGRLKVDGASYDQIKTIFDQYSIGDKYREDENGERYLKRCWNRVAVEKAKKEKPKFYPTPLAVELCQLRDDTLAYVTEQDQFYDYKNGLWKIATDGYVEKAIRDLIKAKTSDWDTQAKRNEVLSALKDYLTCYESRDKFDVGINPNLTLINLKNGMLNWETGELKPHDKSYYSTCQLNVSYDPKAKSELWDQCLIQWIPDEKTRLFMQEFSGYCLIPDTRYHRAVILIGAGNNGKSTFLYTIEELFGKENLSSIPLAKLAERFEIAQIQHKLVNVCADIESGYIEQTSNIKKIISGDTLRGELKYKPSFDFTPVARLWFSCNEIPKASDRSEAWYRRFEYATFPNRFEGDDQDTRLKEKLTEPETLSTVLNWALEGLRRLDKQGRFTISDQMIEVKEQYELENDNVAAFVDEMIEFPVECNIPKTWLYQKYVEYCDNSGTKPIGKRRFIARIKSYRFEETMAQIEVCPKHREFRCTDPNCVGDAVFEWKTARCFYGLNYIQFADEAKNEDEKS